MRNSAIPAVPAGRLVHARSLRSGTSSLGQKRSDGAKVVTTSGLLQRLCGRIMTATATIDGSSCAEDIVAMSVPRSCGRSFSDADGAGCRLVADAVTIVFEVQRLLEQWESGG